MSTGGDNQTPTVGELRQLAMANALSELTELTKRHGVRLVGVPRYVTDGAGGWRLVVDVQLAPAE